jgi:hypothetical protein
MKFVGPHALVSLSTLLEIRAGMNVSVRHAPDGFFSVLTLPAGAALVDDVKTGLDIALFFAKHKVELVDALPKLARGIAVNGSIWVAFEHFSQNELAPGEEFIRLAALECGLVDTKLVLLDPNWSALRLQWKPRNMRPEKPRVVA